MNSHRVGIKMRYWTLHTAGAKRSAVDCQPNGKWRLGDTVGIVPKGHDCILEGFVIRKGRTVRKGTIAYVPNGGGEMNYIFRGNDVE